MKLYKIKDWDAHFENAKSRQIDNLTWFSMPNRLDNLGFRRIAAEPDRCELFSAWCIMLQVASRHARGMRGTLIQGGIPLNSMDLSLISGFPEKIFAKALDFFENLGWIFSEEISEQKNFPEVPQKTRCPQRGRRSKSATNAADNATKATDCVTPRIPSVHEVTDCVTSYPRSDAEGNRIEDNPHNPPLQGDGVSGKENVDGAFLRVVHLVNPEATPDKPRPKDEIDAWDKRTYTPTPEDLDALEALYSAPKATTADETWTRKRNVFLLIDGLQRCAEEARAWRDRHTPKAKRPPIIEPLGWRAKAKDLFPENDFDRMSWPSFCQVYDAEKRVLDALQKDGPIIFTDGRAAQ